MKENERKKLIGKSDEPEREVEEGRTRLQHQNLIDITANNYRARDPTQIFFKSKFHFKKGKSKKLEYIFFD